MHPRLGPLPPLAEREQPLLPPDSSHHFTSLHRVHRCQTQEKLLEEQKAQLWPVGTRVQTGGTGGTREATRDDTASSLLLGSFAPQGLPLSPFVGLSGLTTKQSSARHSHASVRLSLREESCHLHVVHGLHWCSLVRGKVSCEWTSHLVKPHVSTQSKGRVQRSGRLGISDRRIGVMQAPHRHLPPA